MGWGTAFPWDGVQGAQAWVMAWPGMGHSIPMGWGIGCRGIERHLLLLSLGTCCCFHLLPQPFWAPLARYSWHWDLLPVLQDPLPVLPDPAEPCATASPISQERVLGWDNARCVSPSLGWAGVGLTPALCHLPRLGKTRLGLLSPPQGWAGVTRGSCPLLWPCRAWG